jgi:tetratricopeptide (TPR) repeat protein
VVAGELALTTHQAGFNLYIGNNPANPTPYFQPAPFASALPSEAETLYRIEASRRTGRVLSYQEAERFWFETVAAYAREHPSEFLAKIGQRALALFNRFEAGDHYDWRVLGESALFFQIPFLGFFLLAPLGLAGMTWYTGRDVTRWSLVLLGSLYACTLLWFPMIGRYRLPLLVILIIFAAFILAKLLDAWRDCSWSPLFGPGVTALVCLSLVSLPIEGSRDRSGYYNIQAWMFLQEGKLEDAAAIWRFSSGLNGAYSVYANLSLARMALQQKDVESARRYLNKVPDSSFGAASKYDVLGDLFVLTKQFPEAMAAYRRSLEINSGNLSPRQKLVALLSQFDPERAREESRRLDEVASFYADLHHPLPGASPSFQKRSALVR